MKRARGRRGTGRKKARERGIEGKTKGDIERRIERDKERK